MERKSIGQFIAALRKVNGMTQKQLAEKLNVSDKAVSRWERDECAPDLSLIPVIAEVFGVSCDELLCGERRPSGEEVPEDGLSSRGEKQRRRLLASALSEYRNRSFVTGGVAVMGLLAAMVCNFGFNRAYIGFLVGAAFYLASAVCQAVFINKALFSVSGDDGDDGVGEFKRSVAQMAEYALGLPVVLAAASLPLVIIPWDTYQGLMGITWLVYGGLCGAAALLVWWVVRHLINSALARRGVWQLTGAERRYERNFRLKALCGAVLAAALLLTLGVELSVSHGNSPAALAEGTVFEDYDSFVAFMERDVSSYIDDNGQLVVGSYYDGTGDELTDEDVRMTLEDADGNILCEYVDRNDSVIYINYGNEADGWLPIQVVTINDLPDGRAKLSVIVAVFAAIGAAEVAAAVVVYFKKREK